MNIEFALLRPGVLFIQVLLLLGLLIVHVAGGKLPSNPSITGGDNKFVTVKDLLNVSFEGSVSPVPVLLTGLPTYALIVCVPAEVIPDVSVTVAFAPGFIV